MAKRLDGGAMKKEQEGSFPEKSTPDSILNWIPLLLTCPWLLMFQPPSILCTIPPETALIGKSWYRTVLYTYLPLTEKWSIEISDAGAYIYIERCAAADLCRMQECVNWVAVYHCRISIFWSAFFFLTFDWLIDRQLVNMEGGKQSIDYCLCDLYIGSPVPTSLGRYIYLSFFLNHYLSINK